MNRIWKEQWTRDSGISNQGQDLKAFCKSGRLATPEKFVKALTISIGSPTRPPQGMLYWCCGSIKEKRAVLRVSKNDSRLESDEGCLASGYPFVFGFTVISEFWGSRWPLNWARFDANPGEQAVGGHAVPWVGYDDSQRVPVYCKEEFVGRDKLGWKALPPPIRYGRNQGRLLWTIRPSKLRSHYTAYPHFFKERKIPVKYLFYHVCWIILEIHFLCDYL